MAQIQVVGLTSLQVGQVTEFGIQTHAEGYSGLTVARIDIGGVELSLLEAEYYEITTESWQPLDLSVPFGSAVSGVPLLDMTVQIRLTPLAGSERKNMAYQVTVLAVESGVVTAVEVARTPLGTLTIEPAEETPETVDPVDPPVSSAEATMDELVEVVISRDTAFPSVPSYSEHLIADEFSETDVPQWGQNRIGIFSKASELTSIGFSTDSFVYKHAQALFAQNPHIGKIHVGRKDPTEAWNTALDAITIDNNDWYVLSASASNVETQLEIAQWAQGNAKLYLVDSADLAIAQETGGDIATIVQNYGLDHVSVCFNEQAFSPQDGGFSSAISGKMLTADPGSILWANKALAGVPVSKLSGAEFARLNKKNVTYMRRIAGLNLLRGGRVANGEGIDIIHGLDWLKTQIQLAIFTVLVNGKKYGYTDTDIAIFSQALTTAVNDAVNKGIIQDPVITVPKAADIQAIDKAEGILKGFHIEAQLTGAIRKVGLSVSVSY
jgi:hypothetical protein